MQAGLQVVAMLVCVWLLMTIVDPESAVVAAVFPIPFLVVGLVVLRETPLSKAVLWIGSTRIPIPVVTILSISGETLRRLQCAFAVVLAINQPWRSQRLTRFMTSQYVRRAAWRSSVATPYRLGR